MSKLVKWVVGASMLVVVVILVQSSTGPGVITTATTTSTSLHGGASPFVGGGGDVNMIRTEDIVSGKFYSRNANCSWVGDNLSWVTRTGDLVTYSFGGGGGISEGNKELVVRGEQFIGRPWKVRFSGDAGKVLVGFEPRRIFRSTILARYAVHDSSTGQLLTQLRVTPSSSSSEKPDSFQAAVWSNNDTLIATHKNDLYAIKLTDGSTSGSSKVKRLTTDGSDTVVNGVADWVYEEEIFTTSSTTIYPSPTGSYVAWLKFNDTEVDPVSYNLYGDYSSQPYFDEYFQYPKFGTVRYPKSGTRNPSVSLHVFNLNDEYCWQHHPHSHQSSSVISESCMWSMDLDDMMIGIRGKKDEEYVVGAVKWVDNSNFVVQVLNRVQNSTWLVNCDVGSRTCKLVRSWDQSNGWVDVSQILVSNRGSGGGGVEMFTLMSVGGLDGLEYNHVAGISGDRVRFVTRGTFSVDEIVGVYGDIMVIKSPLLDTSRITMVKLSDATQTHYYALNVTNPLAPPSCLTCYGNCTYNNAKFSGSGSYFVNTCERQKSVLHVDLLEIIVQPQTIKSNVIMKLEENKHLDTILSGYVLPEVEYFTYDYKLGGRTYKVNCRVTGGRGWRNRVRDVAVIVDVYGGPNSQKVTKRFTPNDWSYALTSNPVQPVVYLTIDGVGSGRQSNSLSFEVYRDLGDKEIVDKIKILQRFVEENKAIDPKKTMIWGWSYGGYLTAMVMGKDTDQAFKCGISVAPVVNWHYYDTIYTERYMSTPEDNPGGYNTSNVLQYLGNFRNKKFLLVHGNADDNVHYQQSMVLARGLEQQGILFRMHSYPDENHSLGGVRPHLFATLDDFVMNQCFKD